MIKSLLSIVVLGLACGGGLHLLASWTQPFIDAHRAEIKVAVFRVLRPEIVDLATLEQALIPKCDDWHIATVSTQGYGGPIELAYTVHPERGRVSFRTVAHRETPGFGDFITGSWLVDVDNSDLVGWQQLDRVSGATITYRAIKSAAIDVLENAEHCHDE